MVCEFYFNKVVNINHTDGSESTTYISGKTVIKTHFK